MIERSHGTLLTIYIDEIYNVTSSPWERDFEFCGRFAIVYLLKKYLKYLPIGRELMFEVVMILAISVDSVEEYGDQRRSI